MPGTCPYYGYLRLSSREGCMITSARTKNSPLKFIAFVYVLSIPFWLIGWLTESATKSTKVNIPTSALMAACPIIAALIFTYREKRRDGTKRLLARIFDFKRINRKAWYAPIILLMPVVSILAYAVMRIAGLPLPRDIYLPFQLLPVFIVVFFAGAIGEEVGWSGYVTGPLQERLGALGGSLTLGTAWAAWHVVPYLQAHNSITWIAWQCLATVGLRVLIVWIFNNTSSSVFAAIAFHTMVNVCDFMFPNYGSHYDPEVFAIIVAATVIIVVACWGPGTLAGYRRREDPTVSHNAEATARNDGVTAVRTDPGSSS
jgi:membrane protease YdiL (CAAX protease family)